MPSSRAKAVSSGVIRGALIEETYRALSAWDFAEPDSANWRRLESENTVGAASASWLHKVAAALHSRFDPSGRDRALTELAQANCPQDVWRPILLWHLARSEYLLRDWLVTWLFVQYTKGEYRLRSADVETYLLATLKRRDVTVAREWSAVTLGRVANGLLRAAADFGLLTGTVDRTFAGYHLPEAAFLYLLHAVAEREANASRLVHADDWRIYLMDEGAVEREILRLHQYRRLDYRVAGSLTQLQLPQQSALDYVREAMT